MHLLNVVRVLYIGSTISRHERGSKEKRHSLSYSLQPASGEGEGEGQPEGWLPNKEHIDHYLAPIPIQGFGISPCRRRGRRKRRGARKRKRCRNERVGKEGKEGTLFPSLHVARLLLPPPLTRSLFTYGIRSTNFAPDFAGIAFPTTQTNSDAFIHRAHTRPNTSSTF